MMHLLFRDTDPSCARGRPARLSSLRAHASLAREHEGVKMPSTTVSPKSASAVLSALAQLLPDPEGLYKDLHAHPELSMQETRTAQIAADRLGKDGDEVTAQVGKIGVVGLLKNGAGPTVIHLEHQSLDGLATTLEEVHAMTALAVGYGWVGGGIGAAEDAILWTARTCPVTTRRSLVTPR
jgi:hypothetical protein